MSLIGGLNRGKVALISEETFKSDIDLIKYILGKYSYEEIYNAFKSDTSIPVEKINCNDKYRLEKLLERSIANHNRCNKHTGLYGQKDMKINIIFNKWRKSISINNSI